MGYNEVEKEVIKRWGTPEQYYAEKERFLKEHEKAPMRTITNDGLLVSVSYYFTPVQVYLEHQELMRKLAEEEPADKT